MDTDNLNKLSDGLLSLIMKLNGSLMSHDELIKGPPFPPSHVKVIICLAQLGPLSITQLSQRLNISKPNMTPIIDKLILEGLVTRSEDPNDRRVIKVEITKKACDLFEAHKEKVTNSLTNKLAKLNSQDLNDLEHLTSALSTIISKLK